MNRQAENPLDTKVFIAGPHSAEAPQFPSRCLIASVTLMGLMNLALVMGLCFCNTDNRGEEPRVCNETTFKKYTGLKLKDVKMNNNIGEYDIFTTEKTGTYFIHGQVTSEDSEGKVFLKWHSDSAGSRCKETCEIEVKSFKSNIACNSEIIFAKEYKLQEGNRIYLIFNHGKPNLEQSNFTVYMLSSCR